MTPPDREPSEDAADPEGRDERRRKRRAAVRPHESGAEPGGEAAESGVKTTGTSGETTETGGKPAAGDRWAPPGVDPDDVPSYFPELSVDDPDPPPIVDRLGSVGIYLAVAALAFAVIGMGAAARGVQPLGNAVITLSLGLGIVAMVFAMVFQAFASDLLSGSE